MREFQRAYELDPLNQNAGAQVALILRILGRRGESVAVLERLKALNSRNPRVYVGLAECYMLGREFTEAQKMLDVALKLNPREPLARMNQGLVYAFTGRRKEAEETLNDFQHDDNEATRLYAQLFIHAALGNFDEAFKALHRMSETHSWPFLIKTLPVFEELRKDQRYGAFITKMGLPH